MGAAVARPRVDRRQLQQIIAGLGEGILLIDPDRSIAWANETALAIHGCERLEELGADATQYRRRFALKYRNHHRLTAKQYPVERVLAGEAFDDVVVEVSRPRDEDFHRVHRVRGFALTNADDVRESLVLVIQDVTARYSAEDRFEQAFNANPAPALICRLSDLRYIRVNQGFLEMSGYGRDAVVGRTVYELDVLEQAERRDEAVAYLHEGHTISQREAVLRLPGGDGKFVIVAGQPIEVGDEDCMLFTFIDLDARKQAELSLGQSEERFSKAFRLAPVPMMVCALPGLRLIEVNDAFAGVTGHAVADAVGRSPEELDLWPDARAWRRLAARLEAREDVRHADIPMRTREGALIDCQLSADTVSIQDEPCALCVLQDVTEHKRSELDLVAAIEAVMKDTTWFSRTVMERLAQIRQPRREGEALTGLDDLTPREREVLGLICKGLSDADIAAALKLSRHTVRNHVATLYGKIGVNRRSAAVVWGRERGVAGY